MAKSSILSSIGKSVIKVATKAATLGNDPKIIATKVLPTLKAAVTNNPVAKALGFKSEGVTSNTGIKSVDKILGAAASSPFSTAALGAVAAAPKLAVAAAKEVIPAVAKNVGKTVSGLSTKSKILLGTGAVVGPNVISSSPKTQKALGKATKDPVGELAQLGTDIGKFVEQPSVSTARDIIDNSPLLAPVAVLATGAVAARPLLGAVPSLLATSALRDTAQAIEKQSSSPVVPTTITRPVETMTASVSSPTLSPQPSTQPLTTISPDKGITKTTRKRRKIRPLPPEIRNIFKPQVMVVNRNG